MAGRVRLVRGPSKLALIMAFVNLGNVVGPMLGGVVLNYGDWRLFFVANVAGAPLWSRCTRCWERPSWPGFRRR